ncbi:MAG: anion permease, partial [Defluviicoccus sp.]|nr:anion permease [Defluviicoccus sp.]
MNPRTIVSALVVVAGIAIWFLPDPEGGPAGVWHACAVVVIAIGLWATAALPEYFTALIFLMLAVTVGGIAPDLAFSGFHATATWLIFGGLVIGYAVDITGLGARMAAVLVPRMANGYLPMLAGIVAMAAAMGLVVPGNSGRVAILVPIVM